MEDPYNYLRIAAMQMVKDSVVKKGNLQLEYVHVENSNINLFRIAGDQQTPVTDKMNTILNGALLESAARYFACNSYEYALRHVLVSGNVMSINTFEEYECSGAHPDYENLPININTTTGEPLQLEDVLYLYDGTVPKPETDEWLTYRHDIYGPALVKLLKDLHPKQMKDKEPCNYAQDYIWDYAKWYLTEDGLYLSPEFPHVVAICRDPEWSVIPYKILKEYKNPKVNIELP